MSQIAFARQTEPVVTVVADFERDAVASDIVDVHNVQAGDCFARRASIPARGLNALAVEIGATVPGASVAADLLLRVPIRFAQADRVATYCWIKSGALRLGFRVRDAQDRIWETPLQPVRTTNRWVNIEADLRPALLRAVTKTDEKLTWPIQMLGYRIETDTTGRQTAFLDDLRVMHRVRPSEIIVGRFEFDKPTKIYEPGETVGAVVSLENRSPNHRVTVAVELEWVRDDQTRIQTQRRSAITLPPSGNDYRSRQPIDFSHRITRPGLYRLVARVRAADWPTSRVFETAIAVMPSNRNLSRGRSVFIGLRTNLFREPLQDRQLEIALARAIGVHLLAIDTPWSMLQPKPQLSRFEPLDRVVDAVAQNDMSVLITLTDAPDWLEQPGQDFGARQAALIESLARRYGDRARRFQLLSDPRNTTASVRKARDAARSVRADVAVFAPPVRLPPSAAHGSSQASEGTAAGPAATDAGGINHIFATEGDATTAADTLDRFTAVDHPQWRPTDWWQHTAAPEMGAGAVSDADAIMRDYAAALAHGVGGLIWFDLRDDDNDPSSPGRMRGLVRRDFSPKNSLLGFASAARIFTGMRYAGEVPGAPPECESAYFIGSERHLAMIVPKPNRDMPAVLAPFHTAPGELEVFDYQSVPHALLRSKAPPLLIAMQRPFFVALNLVNSEPDPQLGFGQSWLSLPSQVFLEQQATLVVEIVAPVRLANSFLQIEIPASSPLTSNLKAKALRARAGDKILHDIVLSTKGDADFQHSRVNVKLDIEGDEISVPIRVVRQAVVQRTAPDAAPVTVERRIARLAGPARGGTASVEVFAGYTSRALTLTLDVTDDKRIPFSPSGGDELRFGLAWVGGDDHVEVRLIPDGENTRLVPLGRTDLRQLRGWTCRLAEADNGPSQRFVVTIPAKSWGLPHFAAEQRLLVCVKYRDDDGGPSREEYAWGDGLEGSGSTVGYLPLRLARRR